MNRLRSLVISAALTPALASAALAQSIPLAASPTHLQEVPHVVLFTTTLGAPRPISFGFATFTLNAAGTELSFVATIHNIDVTGTQTADPNDDLRAAHIHAPAAPGSNAPPVFGFFGAPFSDVLAPQTTLTPFAVGVGGTFAGTWNATEGNATTLTAQIPNVLNGLAYINFHTAQNPMGEIRGQISVVPEPATVLLLGTGLLGVGLVGIRRRRNGAV